MNKEVKKKLISTFQRNEKDTGSVELQIALLTQRIETLTNHFQTNKKDYRKNTSYIISNHNNKIKLLF